MEAMSDINRNGQCTNLLDRVRACVVVAGGGGRRVCSTFPRMSIGQIPADKDFNEPLLVYSIPSRRQAQVTEKC